MFVVHFSFFNASSLVISVVTCAKDPSGHKYMTAQHYESVRCDSNEWRCMVKAAIVGAVFLIVQPLIVFTILLHRYRKNLEDATVKPCLGYLYASYRPVNIGNTTFKLRDSYWYFFEIGYMIIRFSLAVGLSVPITESVWAPCAVLLLFLFLSSSFLKLQPYTRSVDNKAAFYSIITLIILLFASVQINSVDKNPMNSISTWFEVFGFVVFGGVNCCTVMMFIVLIVWYERDDIKANMNSVKESFVSCWNRLKRCRKSIIAQDQQSCLN